MKRYNPADIEPKWQQAWAKQQLYAAKDFDKSRPKYVMLTEFPYPSGDGLHLGHVREYTLGDILARFKRMQGYNVLYPMGFDAFGLPTENFAIKNKIAPQVATERNAATFQKQFESLGLGIDWSRSFRTTDPAYYKWTQWLFLQFFKAGLAYQEEIAINWCPKCKTGLANEEVVNGRHERCDTLVEKKTLKQWMLRITQYADRLIDGLNDVDYPSRIADQQINWIGRSRGAEIEFKVADSQEVIKVFTTRADTIFGATFMVLAPEHRLVGQLTTSEQRQHVNTYLKAAQAKSDIERQDTNREKTGVFTGAYAVNPANGDQIPIWVADYVLSGYGTGAIMAVPAHDDRDFAFASKHNLPITPVVALDFGEPHQNETYVEGSMVIGYDPRADTYLAIRWPDGRVWLAGGGKEPGENFEQTARRELREETGYTQAEAMIPLGEPTFSHYFNEAKQLARRSYSQAFLFILDSAHAPEAATEAHETFMPEWFDYEALVVALRKTRGGVDHWLDALARAKAAAEAYRRGEPYQAYLVQGEGLLINSGDYTGLATAEAREKIVADLSTQGQATERLNYRLRDWIFSRQHYWGEPIPIVHCPTHGAVPVPDSQLPVELPAVEFYEPTDTGESPLAAIESWVHTTCPVCQKPAKRETDTMPNWAGSSWYYLRYFDAQNDQAFADRKKLDYWGDVDLYLGGMEHTTLHLLYSRFWHQFFYDQGLVPTPEPYKARRGQGIILAADGSKMSKSRGNVVSPNEIIENGYGADALRLSIAFLAPYDQTTPWNPEGVAGTFRFLQRFWTLVQEILETADTNSGQQAGDERQLQQAIHGAIKKVTEDVRELGFNTAIACLMETVNTLYKLRQELPVSEHRAAWRNAVQTITQLLAPFAPHICDELWQAFEAEGSVHVSQWPAWDEARLQRDTLKIAVQVNGKLRASLQVPAQADENLIRQQALQHENVQKFTEGREPRRVIYVPGRLVNIVL